MEGSQPGSYRRARERAGQERDLRTAHRLATAEFALAHEGARIGRALAEAGLAFDPRTFAALRVLESSIEEDLDPVQALSSAVLHGLIERSAALTSGMLAGDD